MPEPDVGSPNGWNLERQSRAKQAIRQYLLDEWQESWNKRTKGVTTHKYFPSIRERMRISWIEGNFYSRQMLTGQCNFNAKLMTMSLVDSDLCECGQIDTVEHVLFECQVLNEERESFKEKLRTRGITWPPNEKRLIQGDLFDLFSSYARAILKLKENVGFLRAGT